MKLHFDSSQEYQIEAIRAITNIFEGQPLSCGDFEFSLNEAFIQVESIKAAKTKITAKIKIDCNTDKGVVKKSVTIKAGGDIYKFSKQREIYKEGFIIDEIDAGRGLRLPVNHIGIGIVI